MNLNQLNKPIAFDRSIAVKTFLRPVANHLERQEVTEIAIVRAGELFTRESGKWVRHNCKELSYDHLMALSNGLAAYNNVAKHPVMSVVLPGGERGQLVFPPACIADTVAINIRKHAQIVMTLEDLIEQGVFNKAVDAANKYSEDGLTDIDKKLLELKDNGKFAQFLHEAVLAKRNIVVSGATGSGKTTFARSLIERVPTNERLITIEDVHELFLPNHANRVHLMYGDKPGQVSATACLAACMRLSPDRIFLAELRESEAWDYLAALNTGHPGSITTTHANSAYDTFNRLAILIKQSTTGGQLDLATIQEFLRQTVDIVLYFERFKLKEIWYDPYKRNK